MTILRAHAWHSRILLQGPATLATASVKGFSFRSNHLRFFNSLRLRGNLLIYKWRKLPNYYSFIKGYEGRGCFTLLAYKSKCFNCVISPKFSGSSTNMFLLRSNFTICFKVTKMVYKRFNISTWIYKLHKNLPWILQSGSNVPAVKPEDW